jgi:hypothetical protein
MGEILGIGLSHYPPLAGVNQDMAHPLRSTLADESIPAIHRISTSWPLDMQAEWGDDEGLSAAPQHRRALVEAFGQVRRAIDDFDPDAIVIIGDDQYENFREDIIPAYALLAYGDLNCRPWEEAQHSSTMAGCENIWGEGRDTEFEIRGHPALGRAIARGLLERDIDIAYAYQPLHHPSLSHAFINALLFLDYERTGMDYPIIPITVNCYGSAVVSRRGYIGKFDGDYEPDPPSPSPRRLMAVGSALADVIGERDERIALVASSSWSHAFLCDKTYRIRPDTPADRELFGEMVDGDYAGLHARGRRQLEESGQHEVLNWYVLFGAMQAMGRIPRWSALVETQVFNSNKAFAIYPTNNEAPVRSEQVS